MSSDLLFDFLIIFNMLNKSSKCVIKLQPFSWSLLQHLGKSAVVLKYFSSAEKS